MTHRRRGEFSAEREFQRGRNCSQGTYPAREESANAQPENLISLLLGADAEKRGSEHVSADRRGFNVHSTPYPPTPPIGDSLRETRVFRVTRGNSRQRYKRSAAR